MSDTQKNNTFARAIFTNSVWQKAGKVMDLYKRGELKRSKVIKNRVNLKTRVQAAIFCSHSKLATIFSIVVLSKSCKKGVFPWRSKKKNKRISINANDTEGLLSLYQHSYMGRSMWQIPPLHWQCSPSSVSRTHFQTHPRSFSGILPSSPSEWISHKRNRRWILPER